jgi:hypothetical protein
MNDIRPVFYVSDGTGITAETIGHSLLTQFTGSRFKTDRMPFVDTPLAESELLDLPPGHGPSWSIPAWTANSMPCLPTVAR